MNEPKRIFNYYVEMYHKDVDQAYILQTRFFEAKKEAISFAKKFLKNVDYIEGGLVINLMACYGDEENYDIITLGYFEDNGKYVETLIIVEE